MHCLINEGKIIPLNFKNHLKHETDSQARVFEQKENIVKSNKTFYTKMS